jgi:hypothetical protein
MGGDSSSGIPVYMQRPMAERTEPRETKEKVTVAGQRSRTHPLRSLFMQMHLKPGALHASPSSQERATM